MVTRHEEAGPIPPVGLSCIFIGATQGVTQGSFSLTGLHYMYSRRRFYTRRLFTLLPFGLP